MIDVHLEVNACGLFAKTYYLGRNRMELEKIDQDMTKPLPANKISVTDDSAQHEPADANIVTRIAVSAYYKAEARGYEPGHEIQDWLAAEAEILH